MEGTYDVPNKKPNFFVIADRTKLDGVFAEMQIIDYSFVILNHIQIDSPIWKLLML